jgi:hypothetical protein
MQVIDPAIYAKNSKNIIFHLRVIHRIIILAPDIVDNHRSVLS